MSLTMDPRFAPKKRLDERAPVEATFDAIAAPMQPDSAKIEVMIHLRKLVADGFAEWQTRDNGTIPERQCARLFCFVSGRQYSSI